MESHSERLAPSHSGRAKGRVARLFQLATSPSVPYISTHWRYVIPVIATAATFLIQFGLFPRPAHGPFAFFYVGIALASWLGGRIPGFITVVLSAVANYAFIGSAAVAP